MVESESEDDWVAVAVVGTGYKQIIVQITKYKRRNTLLLMQNQIKV